MRIFKNVLDVGQMKGLSSKIWICQVCGTNCYHILIYTFYFWRVLSCWLLLAAMFLSTKPRSPTTQPGFTLCYGQSLKHKVNPSLYILHYNFITAFGGNRTSVVVCQRIQTAQSNKKRIPFLPRPSHWRHTVDDMSSPKPTQRKASKTFPTFCWKCDKA